MLQIERGTFIIWLKKIQMAFLESTPRHIQVMSITVAAKAICHCINKCYYAMMLYILIIHYDSFVSHHHGAQENETQDYLVRTGQAMTPVLNRVLH